MIYIFAISSVALLGHVEALRADEVEFRGGEFHSTLLFRGKLNARGSSLVGASVQRGSNKGAIRAENGAKS